MHLATSTLVCAGLCGALGAQADWTRLTPKTSPPVHADHVLVTDVRGILMFGGAAPGGVMYNTTWRWNGIDWSQLKPTTKPPPRLRHSGAYDRGRSRFVVFGGRGANGLLGDTWEFDGANWKQITPKTSPTPRRDHAMTYDWRMKRVLLFGGRDAAGDNNETWTWDGVNWTRLTPKTSPPVRRDHTMVYDINRGRAVTYGGFFGSGVRSDTWEWDGTTWAQKTSSPTPPPLVGNSLTYDRVRQRTVMFSGYNGSSQPPSTWEWDGAKWTLHATKSAPGGRSGHATAWDPLRRRVLLFAGWTNSFQSDTWAYATGKVAGFTSFGNGCKGSAGTPVLQGGTQLPWLGQTMSLEASSMPATAPAAIFLGFSNKLWGPFKLPFKLDGLGMTGCFLNVSPDLLDVVQNKNGKATWLLKLPNNAAFAGVSLFHQLLVIDKVNAFGATMSNGVESKLGAL